MICFMGRINSDKKILEAFARRLTTLRQSRRLSQKALAEGAYLDRSYIVRLEAAERNPTLLVLHDLAKALRTRAEALIKTR